MKTGFKLAKASAIDIKQDCFWELYFPTGVIDPTILQNLMLDDFELSIRFEDIRFQDVLENYLNSHNSFDFDYSPKDEDIVFLQFEFEGTNLKYTFTYSSNKNKWFVPTANASRYSCIEKSISGLIVNPLSILLEWA